MQLTQFLPKMAPAGEEFLTFCSTEEGLKEILNGCGGRALVIADGLSCERAISLLPHTAVIVAEEDVLPLFSLPQAGYIIGMGGKRALHAARYLAELERTPLALFPVLATLEGVTEERAELTVSGEKIEAELRFGRTYCDMQVLEGSLSRAYARLLLGKLERFERRALSALGMGGEAGEEVALFQTPKEIVRANGALTLCGEAGALSALLKADGEKEPEWRAFFQLTALYAAFFLKGKPRRYFIPNYRARVSGAARQVPTAEEYALRALRLERHRAVLGAEAQALIALRKEVFPTLKALSGAVEWGAGNLKWLRNLAEVKAGGLTSLMRDFGLMEW